MAGILKLLLAYCLPKFQTKHQVTFLLWLWHQLWHRRRHNLRFPRQTRTLRKWCVLWRRISTICLVCFPPLWFLLNDYAYFRARSIQAEFPEICLKSNGTFTVIGATEISQIPRWPKQLVWFISLNTLYPRNLLLVYPSCPYLHYCNLLLGFNL